MPLYDYRCEKCGEVFEVRQSFSDATLTVHEGCGGDVKRLISVPALQFKGTGWYVTDYGRGGKLPSSGATESKSEKSESKSDGKAESKGDGKSESKAESKSESKSESKGESKPAPASTSSEK